MAVSIRNVEKFVKDHPELFVDTKDGVLAKAKEAANNGMIGDGSVRSFLGELTSKFFQEVMGNKEHAQISTEDSVRTAHGLDIPKDKNYPEDSVQCNHCGGRGCYRCDRRGWLTPRSHPNGRKCEREACSKPLPPDHFAVYCTNECARMDA